MLASRPLDLRFPHYFYPGTSKFYVGTGQYWYYLFPILHGDSNNGVAYSNTGVAYSCCLFPILVLPNPYKYLGVWLDEHLDYQNCVNALSESARKALGLLIAKSKQFGNFPFEAFSSLYDSLVIPIEWTMGLVSGVTEPSPSYKPFRTRQLDIFWVWVKTAQ